MTRHSITEARKRKGLSDEKTLVQRLCDRQYAGAAAMMLAVFEYFTPGVWVPPERLEKLPQPPNAA